MTFTRQQVLDTMAEVVAGREDYVYIRDHEGCSYAEEDGSPSCLVGHVVARLAPTTFEKFREVENEYDSFDIGVANGGTSRYPRLDATDSAFMALGAAQVSQDDGSTWGAALEAAQQAADE